MRKLGHTLLDAWNLRLPLPTTLAADPQFAADSRARLQWWFQQSKYEPTESGRYPVLRVWQALK